MSGAPTQAALLELTARVEAASGPDRELDAQIWFVAESLPMPVGREWDNYREAVDYMWGRGGFPPSRYTASLDAAVSLVTPPSKWSITAGCNEGRWEAWVWLADGTPPDWFEAATPALALTAAALRARAAQGDPA